MNIAHVQGIFSPEHGGPTQSLTNYCRNQARAGHRVNAWVLEGFPNTSAAIRLEPPVEMHVFPVGWPAALGRSRSLRAHLAAAEKPDIFHLHGTWLRAMYYGAVEARRRKVPCLLETMGMYEAYGLESKWLRKRIARTWFQDNILRQADCLHVGSRQEGEQLRRLGFTQPLAVIPVGVDLQQIEKQKSEIAKAEMGSARGSRAVTGVPPGTTSDTQTVSPGTASPTAGTATLPQSENKNEFQLSEFQLSAFKSAPSSQLPAPISPLLAPFGRDGRPFFLYLARIHEKKGLGMLLKAWAELQRFFPDHILVVGGSGTPDYEDQCRRSLSDLGICGRCLWLGQVSEAEKSWAYTNASFYVLPSYSENYGNTIAEALAHGAPVLTTDATPWSDIPRIGCGWIIPPDCEALREALRVALKIPPEQLRSMGTLGRRWAVEQFSLESVIRKLDATYLWLAGKGVKPGHVV